MSKDFYLEGLSDLEQALMELPRATSRNVLLRTLKKAAEPVAKAGAANAPRRTGGLAESYVVSTKLTKSQKKVAKQSDVEVYVGPTPHPKSIQTEFGNVHQAAEPHLRPAWDSTNKEVLDSIKEQLSTEIEKARERLARKAARLAAKMGAA